MVDITNLNTLRVPTSANELIEINTPSNIKRLDPTKKFMLLGAGANVLFTKDFPGTIVKVNLRGKKIVKETDQEVVIEAAAGENWHDLVTWAVNHNLSGIENMALIPGTVGAAAIGNIAAYGQSFDEPLVSLAALEIATGKTHHFSPSDCQLTYRNSIFQNKYKDKYLVTSAVLRLSKTAHFATNYFSRRESLQDELHKINPSDKYSIKDVYQAVINIRTLKMPDWTKIGTAGSFFKNPFVTKNKLRQLQSQIPELQFYPTTGMDYPPLDDSHLTSADYVKIPAGRLLEELGWKGKKVGRVSTFPQHALVVINLGGASGTEIHKYSEAMRADVKKNFGIDLEYEVNVI